MDKKTKIVKGKHKLSEGEMVDAGKELANALQQKEKISDEAKEKADEFKDKIKEQESAINKCLDKIRTGEEDRDYECNVERDEEKKEKRYIDVDSKRVIKTAPFTAADFQMELTGEAKTEESTDASQEKS